ncbi:hypothetical protein [Rhodoluna sp.]|uniref:hypothetical protein n=1 Tax=Rhodoluna sp. TaxID=1969481 RepID=UPI0025F89D9C|nr:hypothetical protein [Rhodoluna sp.]
MQKGRRLGEMLVSAERGRITKIDAGKVSRGEFFTTDSAWLNKPVRKFLSEAFAASPVALDPFAGDGHLLHLVAAEFGVAIQGFDIASKHWPKNDSLKKIANPAGAVIITNPPYLANHSAKRKGVDSLVAKYFAKGFDNLYKLALDRSLAVADYVVAIVPETFLLSSFDKSRLQLVSVIEGDLFSDTEAPAVVACFGPTAKKSQVFVNNKKIGELDALLALRKFSNYKKSVIHFNVAAGRIGLRAVDSSDGVTPIAFMLAKDFKYAAGKVSHSSRLMTYVEMPNLSDAQIAEVIRIANERLASIRGESQDLVLAPFKGNDKNGKRRRRLDYALAREILNFAARQNV